MMNPFIQKALNDVHTYPTSSASLSSDLVEQASSQKWKLKRHQKTGGLIVDDRFRVKLVPRDESQAPEGEASRISEATMHDVFAIGDVCALEDGPLPATAQVANQEGKWLAKALNKGDAQVKGFSYRNLGVMTYLGNYKAIMQGGGGNAVRGYVVPLSSFFFLLSFRSPERLGKVQMLTEMIYIGDLPGLSGEEHISLRLSAGETGC